MKKDTGQKTDIEPESIDDEEGAVEEVSKIPHTLALRMAALKIRNSFTFEDCKVYLYKFISGTGDTKELVDTFHGQEPPDESEIGLKHGSGRYLMMIFPPDGNIDGVKGYRFRLGKIWDNRRYQQPEQISSPPSSVHVHQAGGGAGLAETMQLMEKILALFSPILTAPRDNSASEMMIQNVKMIGDVMREQAVQQIGFIQEIARAQLTGNGDNAMAAVDTEPQTSLIEQIIPLVNDWLPKLIGNNAQSKAVSTIVRGTPLFNQVVNDRKTIARLIAYLDKEKGREQTDQLLAALKLGRPGSKKAKQ